ncbi:MAG: hypothetical protein IPP25_14365 [Saprospiraceae bacterium]|nr:hypothetical protein [Candidatus Opimibacter skivensis]
MTNTYTPQERRFSLLGLWTTIKILLILGGNFFVLSGALGQTNTWTGDTDNNWNVTTNWSEMAVPTSSHDVVIDEDASIILGAAAYTINSLTISNSSAVTFTAVTSSRTITIDETGSSIGAGSTLTLVGGASGQVMGIAFSGSARTMDISGSLILVSTGGGGKYTATNSVTTVSGSLINSSNSSAITSTASNLIFTDGSQFEHAIVAGSFPAATWEDNSTCVVSGSTTNLPTNGGQTFGNLVYNCPGLTGTLSLPSSGMTIAGDFEILNTGSGAITMSQTPLGVGGDCRLSDDFNVASGASRSLNITGNLTIDGGTISMSTTGSTIGTINVTGDVALTGGTITENGGSGLFVFNNAGVQTISTGSTVTNTINYTVSSGTTLQMAASGTTVIGGGTFTLSAGGTLGVTSDDGISTSGGTGNIQTTGRTYTAGSNLIYNGNASQIAGSGLANTTKANVTINNPGNTVTLSGNTTISAGLTVTAGSTLDVSTYTFSGPTSISLGCGSTTATAITGTGLITLAGPITTTDAGTGTTEQPCPRQSH